MPPSLRRWPSWTSASGGGRRTSKRSGRSTFHTVDGDRPSKPPTITGPAWAEHARRVGRLRKSAQPLTVHLFAKGLPPTLRAMVERLGLLGGKVEAVDGRLVVSLPPGELGESKLGTRIATQLYRAEAELLATRKGDGAITAARVPDRPLLPSGACSHDAHPRTGAAA